MALVLRLEKRKLGETAEGAFVRAESGLITLYVPAMVFAEIAYLAAKQRIEADLDSVSRYMQKFPNVREYPLNLEGIRSAASIADIPDLHDQLIAGAARLLKVGLLTNDPLIQASGFVSTAW